MAKRSMYKNAVELGGFALLSIGLIAVFHLLTKDQIAAEMQAKLARTLGELIEPTEYNNDVYHDCIAIDSNGVLTLKGKTLFYRMEMDQKPVAAMFTVTAPDGYSGAIDLIMAIRFDESIAGVRVIQHNETPGLGDKIEPRKSDWIKQFEGLNFSLVPQENWKVKKDGGSFDGFTGATITPRAVLKAIEKGLSYFVTHKQEIFTTPTNCGGDNSNDN
ncbi:MAG: electron transport complex subunit RsxG [Gammaproteobacteria bacterium]|nr:electron transport complex subunit RsxG [Gammaproteobacteria bacterium]